MIGCDGDERRPLGSCNRFCTPWWYDDGWKAINLINRSSLLCTEARLEYDMFPEGYRCSVYKTGFCHIYTC